MNDNVIASFKLMGMGMTAIFLVIIVIYVAVNLLHRFTNKNPNKKIL
jgi:Na+-transporting methylmalonyl-CoA/oxaloacetate decarboxylase gamma subunit